MTDMAWLTVARKDLEWMRYARCVDADPDCFFPEKGESAEPAKAICRTCVVREECLEYADRNEEWFGVFGGLSENERKRLRGLQLREQGWQRTCPQCGGTFVAWTSTRRLCSNACAAASRQRSTMRSSGHFPREWLPRLNRHPHGNGASV